jgi:hypothetical protein
LVCASVVLLANFSHSLNDSDSWWHLKTGEYIVRQHRLPVPDPFAFTTDMGQPAYPAEPMVRNFNLTHEWLAEVIFYLAYAVHGFAGLVALRMTILFCFCAAVGLLVYQRTKGFYWAVAASLAPVSVISLFATERPHIFTYLLLCVTLLILERGRPVWALPPLFLFWANCHGGYIMGWVALGGYCAQALWLRWRGRPAEHERRLFWVTACCVLATGLNPNGFAILQVLSSYSSSRLQSAIFEWRPTNYWEFSTFNVLLYAGAICLLLSRKRARLVDWLFFAAFAAAGLSAVRNTFLLTIEAPIVIAAYFPWKRAAAWAGQCALLALLMLAYVKAGSAGAWVKPVALGAALAGVYFLATRGLGRIAEMCVALVLAYVAYAQATAGVSFHFVAEEQWYPKGAAEFLLAHHITGPMLNNYHHGGYLIWKLWPQERVFIDGRALNESVFFDAERMQLADPRGGKDPAQLLKDYGIEVILMSGFEFVTGTPYSLIPALAVVPQTEWKLVYQDEMAVVFMRHPPPDVKPLKLVEALNSMEAQCVYHIKLYPSEARCAAGMIKVFETNGDYARAREWLRYWVEHKREPDPEAERAYRMLTGR